MLDIIQNNPYRLLGIYSNSPAKDRVANHNKLKAFLKVGKEVSFDLDLPALLPAITRTSEIVSDADAKLALPNDQLRYAQFWFVKATPLDDVAMNHLIAGSTNMAMSIWEKKDNASSLQNRIVCTLIRNDYPTAILCANELYTKYQSDWVTMILGGQNTAVLNHLEFSFFDELCTSFDAKQLLPYIANNDWRQYLRDKTITPLLTTLRSAIDTAKATRGKGITARYNAGVKLTNDTKDILTQLKTFLSVTDMQYQIIADKLGLEILQCGIDYYNGSEAADAARKAMELQSYALSVVVGKMAKDRCQENVDILQKIIDTLPPMEVFAENQAINKELEALNQLPEIECHHVVWLLKNTKPQLLSIKKQLGSQDTYYLKISTKVVGNALNCIIKEVNAIQNSCNPLWNLPYQNRFDSEKQKYLSNLKETLRTAWEAIKLMETFDMEDSFRKSRFMPNKNILHKICDSVQIETATFSFLRNTSSTRILLWLIFVFIGIFLYLLSQKM